MHAIIFFNISNTFTMKLHIALVIILDVVLYKQMRDLKISFKIQYYQFL